MRPSTRLWRYIGSSYEHHFPPDPFPSMGRAVPLFYRLCQALVALGVVRLEREGGYFTRDGVWVWRFWKPHIIPRWLAKRGGTPNVPWREYLRTRWPGWRWIFTGQERWRKNP